MRKKNKIMKRVNHLERNKNGNYVSYKDKVLIIVYGFVQKGIYANNNKIL